MTYTLADAQARVSTDLLDDSASTYWDSDAISRALKSALSLCLEEYFSNGGKRLRRRLSTSTVDGAVDMAALGVSSVSDVAQLSGAVEHRMPALMTSTRPFLASTVEVVIYYQPSLVLPTVTTHPLLGDGATEEPGAWDAFSEWVCIRAAMSLRASRSQSVPGALLALESSARENVLDAENGPRFFTSSPRSNRRLASQYFWTWDPSTRSVLISLGCAL